MKPAVQDIDIYRGDTFSLFFRVKQVNSDTSENYVDLTGWTGLAQIRTSYDDNSILASLVVTFSNQATYPGGVLLSLSDTITSALSFTGTTNFRAIGVYDVQLTNTIGEPNTFLTGNVTLYKDVSHG